MQKLKNCSGACLLANAFGVSAAEFCAAKMSSARIVASGYSLPETIAMDVAGLIFAVSRRQCR